MSSNSRICRPCERALGTAPTESAWLVLQQHNPRGLGTAPTESAWLVLPEHNAPGPGGAGWVD